MPQEFLSSPDIKAPLLLNGSAGTTGHVPTSQGSAAPPQWAAPSSGFPAGNITAAGAIGSTANLPITTTTDGVLVAGAFGTGAGQFVEGNAASNTDSREWTAPTVTQAEYELGTGTERRAYTPALWWAAFEYWFIAFLGYQYDAKFGRITLGGLDNFIGDFSLITGASLAGENRRSTADYSNLSITYYQHFRWTASISGDATFTINATPLADMLAAIEINPTWHGTLRFTYTSGTLTFFSGATGYTTSWDEGSQPTFVAGQDYLIGVAVSGEAGTIRLSLLNKTVASTLIGGYTSAGMTMATARILGRSTAATGAAEEISIGSGLSLSGGTLTATGSGGSITVQDEGSTLSAAVTQINFTGAGVTATGTTSVTVDIPGGGSSDGPPIYKDAAEFIPSTTAGCGVSSLETATNDVNDDFLLFDTATEEHAEVSFAWPAGWTTARVYFDWRPTTGTGNIRMGAALRCIADGDTADTAYGTAQTVDDAAAVANTDRRTAVTPDITPAGTVATGARAKLLIYRDVTVGTNMAVDCPISGVYIEKAS